ncbi:MAG TPA: nicotinamide-nucleotide amidohydrolase family protein [Steroidobacteraceae bacterium]|nr:nicotinamide-nucleotide amidohydrolase family protein [Steroidobacteraceae bacterium]
MVGRGTSAAAPSDAALLRLAQRLGRALESAQWRLAAAESCTAGWVAKAITDVAGSSRWFESGYVTYSNGAKMRELGVPARTLARYGAVSAQTVQAMARGARRRAGADIAIAVSGIAGPDGAVPGKPVGTVWFGLDVRRGQPIVGTAHRRFRGDREAVRRKSVACALRLLARQLRHAP